MNQSTREINNFFAYGTLLFPEVYQHFLGPDAVWEQAKLSDYQRLSVDGGDACSVPAIVKNTGTSVDGKVFFGIDARCFELLDHFEDIDNGDYLREVVSIEMPDGTTASAQTYIAGPSLEHSLGGNWCPDTFCERCLAEFVAKVLPHYLST
ncbi:MAG: gamma-glutamylcyclotransferase [Bdellovibrionales bacterium]|nr:gamma-glutamylcyclotransferase [Bdellovibrionales bacterium]